MIQLFPIVVNCPEGWYVKEGLCLKAIVTSSGINEFNAGAKCDEVGGFIFEPMNEQYSADLEGLLMDNPDELTETSFWIGLTYSYNLLRKEKIFQFKSHVYVFDNHFNKWDSE